MEHHPASIQLTSERIGNVLTWPVSNYCILYHFSLFSLYDDICSFTFWIQYRKAFFINLLTFMLLLCAISFLQVLFLLFCKHVFFLFLFLSFPLSSVLFVMHLYKANRCLKFIAFTNCVQAVLVHGFIIYYLILRSNNFIQNLVIWRFINCGCWEHFHFVFCYHIFPGFCWKFSSH